MAETAPGTDGSSVPYVEVTPGREVDGSIRPPGSKSLTNRALICAAFAGGTTTLTGALRSEDTEVMIEALRAVGVHVDVADSGRTLSVSGKRHLTSNRGDGTNLTELFMANSGTSIRFLTAALSAAGGHYHLHGVDRMHQRPIGDLIDAIAPVIKGSIEAISAGGCPPVRIQSEGWTGPEIQVAGSVSSQYLSGLMMAAPIRPAHRAPATGTRIAVRGELVSQPYVEMTAKVMRDAISDTVQTLAVVALFAEGPTRVRGVAHNRFKETDRIGDLARELRQLGAGIEEHEDGLTIHPPPGDGGLHGATLETYLDHRMAMSLALAGLKLPGVKILNPACTSKTYPEFFEDLERLIGRPHLRGAVE